MYQYPLNEYRLQWTNIVLQNKIDISFESDFLKITWTDIKTGLFGRSGVQRMLCIHCWHRDLFFSIRI